MESSVSRADKIISPPLGRKRFCAFSTPDQETHSAPERPVYLMVCRVEAALSRPCWTPAWHRRLNTKTSQKKAKRTQPAASRHTFGNLKLLFGGAWRMFSTCSAAIALPPKDDYWLRLCRCGLRWPAALTHNKWNAAIPDKVVWCIRPLLSWHSPYLPRRAKVFQAEGSVTAIRHCSTQSRRLFRHPDRTPRTRMNVPCADPMDQQQDLFTSSFIKWTQR